MIDRSAANAVRPYRDGVPAGAVSTTASGARSAVAMAGGRANGAFVDGQFCAHMAGASLRTAEHRIMADALAAYMAAFDIRPLP